MTLMKLVQGAQLETLLRILNPFCFKLHLRENMKICGTVLLEMLFNFSLN